MTPLTRYEQETIINYNIGEQTATIYTSRDKSGQTYCHTHSNSLSNKMGNSLLAVRDININTL